MRRPYKQLLLSGNGHAASWLGGAGIVPFGLLMEDQAPAPCSLHGVTRPKFEL